MPDKEPKQQYTRAEVRRHFRLTERQLRAWEKSGLLPASDTYTFSGLIAIKTLVKLRENRIPARKIGRALESLRRRLEGIEHPLEELRIVSDGKNIAVHVSGQKMEALTGQILFDFDAAELAVKAFPDGRRQQEKLREAEEWFQKGLELEEVGAPVEQAVSAYKKVLELNPTAAGALVNLGTISYRQRKFADAERYYTRAIAADPEYPLAEFNLGNLYDEQGRVDEALGHYRRALELNPGYADAHFNAALLCERTGDALKAVLHWKNYLKLDGHGKWADIARRQLDKLRECTVISSK